MRSYEDHLISKGSTIREALILLNNLGQDAILFVVDNTNKLVGSLTDGDVRRGLIKGLSIENLVEDVIQFSPKFLRKGEDVMNQAASYNAKNFKIIPIIDENDIIIDILNFRLQKTIILADAVIMAGGEGKRLRPLTESTPKPLLMIGDKPIIEYNIDRLINVGIKNICISINYLGHQLVDYFGNGKDKNANINYVKEDRPLGTIGSVLLVQNFYYDDVIVMNSDLLTNIDLADFFKVFKETNADMAVATTSYHVDVPYAVLEVNEENQVFSLSEKPRYTYYSNAGIYIFKKTLLKMIPEGQFYDVTDLMEALIRSGKKLITYPITGYWLDIGKHEDFRKAQEDIKHINFN